MSAQKFKVGDIIVDKDGQKAKVLAVLPGVFLRSSLDDLDHAYSWYTYEEIDQNAWKLESQEKTTVTREEIAEKFNIPLSKLRIKHQGK